MFETSHDLDIFETRHNRLCALIQRLEAAAAKAVDCRPTRRDAQPGHQRYIASNAEALLPLLLGVAKQGGVFAKMTKSAKIGPQKD